MKAASIATHTFWMLLCAAVCTSAFSFPQIAQAATLSLSPQAQTLEVGERTTVGVYVNTQGASINAVSGALVYDASALEVLSTGKNGSIITLWVQDPVVSAGSVSFEGVALNPGYAGSRGKVLDVVFRAKKETTVDLAIAQASILANDGQGTNILTGTSGSSFTIAPATEEEGPAPTVAPIEEARKAQTEDSAAFALTSATHPDQSLWYSARSGAFSFSLPEKAQALRLVLSRSQSATPSVLYSPAITEKRIDDLPEGTTYLIAQVQVGGVWSKSVSHRLRIDSESPTDLSIKARQRSDATDPMVVLDVTAKDTGSGLAGYRIRIDGGDEVTFDRGADMSLGPLAPGTHRIEVVVFDAAGNTTSSTTEAIVEALPAPQVTGITREVAWGSTFTAHGRASHRGGTAHVTLVSGDDAYTTSATIALDGSFTISRAHDIPSGTYVATVETTDSRGAKSAPSQAREVTFGSRPISEMLLGFGRDLGAAFFVLLALMGFGALVSGLYLKFLRWRNALLKEVREADLTVEKSFTLLKGDIEGFMADLSKESGRRKLTTVERKFLKTMKANLSEASSILKKEIKDIKEKA